jgi:hypothetical protein
MKNEITKKRKHRDTNIITSTRIKIFTKEKRHYIRKIKFSTFMSLTELACYARWGSRTGCFKTCIYFCNLRLKLGYSYFCHLYSHGACMKLENTVFSSLQPQINEISKHYLRLQKEVMNVSELGVYCDTTYKISLNVPNKIKLGIISLGIIHMCTYTSYMRKVFAFV